MSTLDVIGLQTPKARLVAFTSIILYLYATILFGKSILPSLSLYSRLGIDSPSIGLTRAFKHVLQGNLVEAWHINWIIFMVIPILVFIVTADFLKIIKNN